MAYYLLLLCAYGLAIGLLAAYSLAIAHGLLTIFIWPSYGPTTYCLAISYAYLLCAYGLALAYCLLPSHCIWPTYYMPMA